MSARRTRREFLDTIGRGMVVAAVGSTTAIDLALAPAEAREAPAGDRFTFGELEPLVALLQETPPARLVAVLLERLRGGEDLRTLVAAGALANARTFGGEDYVGFHTMMALAPAYHMARELPEDRRALPVLKVLHRNTTRIQEYGGPAKEVLRRVAATPGESPPPNGEELRALVRAGKLDEAERAFARYAGSPAEDAFNALLFTVQDNTEVHRTVLPYRAWDLLPIIGRDHALTLLRQSIHYCVKSEREWSHTPEIDRPRVMLPILLEKVDSAHRVPGSRSVDDAWVESTSRTIFEGTPDQAAEAVAAALAEGVDPGAVGEAIALAANQLVLRDVGRTIADDAAHKPIGSVHGDSIGVHACDSANAWRNMARAASPRNAAACLILGAFQVAYDRVNRGGDFLKWTPRPHPENVEAARTVPAEKLLSELDAAIRANDQERACALAQRLASEGRPTGPLMELLLSYAVSEDGALHAEKYYRTVCEELQAGRPAFRSRQFVALARVTASAYGRKAPMYDEACERLGVEVPRGT